MLLAMGCAGSSASIPETLTRLNTQTAHMLGALGHAYLTACPNPEPPIPPDWRPSKPCRDALEAFDVAQLEYSKWNEELR